MPYRNKTYICFDADTDMKYYKMLKMWKENSKIEFNFYNAHDIHVLRNTSSESTIKRRLTERLKNTKIFVVLIGEKTKNLHKYVRWEINWAIKNDIPIIAVNLNKKNGIDNNYCPPILRDALAIHIPYNKDNLIKALKYWPDQHKKLRRHGKSGSYYYD